MARWWVAFLLASAVARAQQTFPLSYRFQPGTRLEYLTRIEVTGSLTGRTADVGEPSRLPLRVDLEDRLELRCLELADDGSATVELRLLSLHLASHEGPVDLGFELTRDAADQVTIRALGQSFSGPVPGPETPLDETPVAAGLTRGELLAVARPTRLTLAPSGEVLTQDDPLWPRRLQAVPLIGQVIDVIRGPNLLPPALPGEPTALGGVWAQTRQVPLPGGQATYALEVVSSLEGRETVGAVEAARIAFDGEATIADEPFVLEAAPGLAVPMTMTELGHKVVGTIFFDCQAGCLIELKQTAAIEFAATSSRPDPILDLAAKLEVKTTSLLLRTVGP